MPELDAYQLAQAAERQGTDAHVLLWIAARHRTTRVIEGIGFWTGDDHQTFITSGQSRLYFGAGAVIEVAPIRAAIGLKVQTHRVTLPPLRDEVRQALRAYEPRNAEVEIHVCPMDLQSGLPVSDPIRMVKGTLNEAPEAFGPKGEASRVELSISTSARRLTFGLPLFRSSAALKLRNASDRFREYSDVAGDWTVPWGGK
ncbi:hypothetical protein [Maritimibacter alkaliphilus]|uniref:hypothetical protein n=1 Tax=Maritimibacter alkaliphilus TaxID=404236 RepID=UPI001C9727F0|nr:hypothetical protein [Maritimibacter alkaliphilus]MBY6091081.1 hypothetical protein [Maritimibacter alkaliphilus]